MTYKELIEALGMGGKKIRRIGWDYDHYIFLKDNHIVDQYGDIVKFEIYKESSIFKKVWEPEDNEKYVYTASNSSEYYLQTHDEELRLRVKELEERIAKLEKIIESRSIGLLDVVNCSGDRP